jgi:hypothetical protein
MLENLRNATFVFKINCNKEDLEILFASGSALFVFSIVGIIKVVCA